MLFLTLQLATFVLQAVTGQNFTTFTMDLESTTELKLLNNDIVESTEIQLDVENSTNDLVSHTTEIYWKETPIISTAKPRNEVLNTTKSQVLQFYSPMLHFDGGSLLLWLKFDNSTRTFTVNVSNPKYFASGSNELLILFTNEKEEAEMLSVNFEMNEHGGTSAKSIIGFLWNDVQHQFIDEQQSYEWISSEFNANQSTLSINFRKLHELDCSQKGNPVGVWRMKMYWQLLNVTSNITSKSASKLFEHTFVEKPISLNETNYNNLSSTNSAIFDKITLDSTNFKGPYSSKTTFEEENVTVDSPVYLFKSCADSSIIVCQSHELENLHKSNEQNSSSYANEYFLWKVSLKEISKNFEKMNFHSCNILHHKRKNHESALDVKHNHQRGSRNKAPFLRCHSWKIAILFYYHVTQLYVKYFIV